MKSQCIYLLQQWMHTPTYLTGERLKWQKTIFFRKTYYRKITIKTVVWTCSIKDCGTFEGFKISEQLIPLAYMGCGFSLRSLQDSITE